MLCLLCSRLEGKSGLYTHEYHVCSHIAALAEHYKNWQEKKHLRKNH